jgi:hypothetical protein
MQGVGALASAVAGSPSRQMQSPLATHLQPANYIVHTPWTVATPAYNISADHNDSPVATSTHSNTGSGKGKSSSGGNWRQNVALIASCLVMYTCAYFASAVVSKVGRVTGISQEDSIGKWIVSLVCLAFIDNLCTCVAMLVYHAVAAGLHHQMLFVKARLEALVVVVLLWLYGHRVLGYCLGWFLRYKLDPTSSGKFAFHIDWIALRLGLDQNMVVVSGFEWRNPVVFKNTPYLLRIGEISVVVDAMSIYGAIMKNAPIKVKEIRVNRVTLYLEKLTADGTAVKEEERVGATAVATAQSTDGNATVAVVESLAVKAPEEGPTTPTTPRTAGRAERARSAQRDSAGTQR